MPTGFSCSAIRKENYGQFRPCRTLDVQLFPQRIFPLPVRLAPFSCAISPNYAIYASEDAVFTSWLAQKLLSFGYKVWCDLIKQVVIDSYPNDIDDAIRNKSGVVIAIISKSAFTHLENTRQRTLALQVAKDQNREHLIAITLEENLPLYTLDRDTKSLKFIDFFNGWGVGLEILIDRLKTLNIPTPIINGKKVASKAFSEDDVILEEAENVYLNCFRVLEIPKIVHRFKAEKGIGNQISKEIQSVWPHRRIDDFIFLSFFAPPYDLKSQYGFQSAGGGSTELTPALDGVVMPNLVSELIKKSLYTKCFEKGLKYCVQTDMYYFPNGLIPSNRLTFIRPDGSSSWVNVTGERKFWRPGKEEYYQYSLSPVFYISQRLYDSYVVLLRVRVRITNTDGYILPARTALSRRKHLTNDWWNKEWGDRFFAITEYLAETGEIIVGTKKNEQIRVEGLPTKLVSPISIKEDQIEILNSQEVRLWAGSYDEFEEDGEGENQNEQ